MSYSRKICVQIYDSSGGLADGNSVAVNYLDDPFDQRLRPIDWNGDSTGMFWGTAGGHNAQRLDEYEMVMRPRVNIAEKMARELTVQILKVMRQNDTYCGHKINWEEFDEMMEERGLGHVINRTR